MTIIVYKVIISDLAKADLHNIIFYINRVESYVRAKFVEREILATMKYLYLFPHSFPKDPYITSPKLMIRFVTKWHYKILFTIIEDKVLVIRIFHTAQNPEKLGF